MPQEGDKLELIFNIAEPVSDAKRQAALTRVRDDVFKFTGRRMALDALCAEILKNIIDHANGRGSLVIVFTNGAFEFTMRDESTESFNLETCRKGSRFAGDPTNTTNHGAGLGIIDDIAATYHIQLVIDTSRGFCYSGVYRPATEPALN